MRRFSFFILLAGIILSCGGGNDDDANIINPPVVTDPDTTKTDWRIGSESGIGRLWIYQQLSCAEVGERGIFRRALLFWHCP